MAKCDIRIYMKKSYLTHPGLWKLITKGCFPTTFGGVFFSLRLVSGGLLFLAIWLVTCLRETNGDKTAQESQLF